MCFRTLLTSGITSWPSTTIGLFDRLRKAICNTGRFSVTLIRSPLNKADLASSTLRAFA